MAKVTKREMFVEIVEALELAGADPTLVEFAEAQIAMLDKRKSAPRKPTADQLANEALKDGIVEFLAESGEGSTATEIAVAMGVTVQKISQLMRQLVEAGRVLRAEGKGKEKTRFSV